MGVAAAARVRERLLEARLPAATPVAIVENGTLPTQRVLVTDLCGLGSIVAAEGVRSPALLIIGESASEAARLAWFGVPPIVQGLRLTA
jgi:uroporphyrin-III C-methyltransferase/precorrin-2 dehydrogenase/sirohydrochlorin ferrochelatase